jgi:hypothetical protein
VGPRPVWTGAENLDPRTVQPVVSGHMHILVVIVRMIIKLASSSGIATRREVTACKTLVTEILIFML